MNFSFKKSSLSLLACLLLTGFVSASETPGNPWLGNTWDRIRTLKLSDNHSMPVIDRLNGEGLFQKKQKGVLDITTLDDAAFKKAFSFGLLSEIDNELKIFETQVTQLPILYASFSDNELDKHIDAQTLREITNKVGTALENVKKLEALRARYIQVYGRTSVFVREQLFNKRNAVITLGLGVALAGCYFADKHYFNGKGLNMGLMLGGKTVGLTADLFSKGLTLIRNWWNKKPAVVEQPVNGTVVNKSETVLGDIINAINAEQVKQQNETVVVAPRNATDCICLCPVTTPLVNTTDVVNSTVVA